MTKAKGYVYALYKVAGSTNSMMKLYTEQLSQFRLTVNDYSDMANAIRAGVVNSIDLQIRNDDLIRASFDEMKKINAVKDVFDYNFPELRTWERGERTKQAIRDIASAYRFISSSEVQKEIEACV